MKDKLLRDEFEKEMGCLPSAYEKDDDGNYEELCLDIAWNMYQIASNKRNREIETLKKALFFKEINDSIGAPKVDYYSWIQGYKESTHFWLKEIEKRENEIVKLKKGL